MLMKIRSFYISDATLGTSCEILRILIDVRQDRDGGLMHCLTEEDNNVIYFAQMEVIFNVYVNVSGNLHSFTQYIIRT